VYLSSQHYFINLVDGGGGVRRMVCYIHYVVKWARNGGWRSSLEDGCHFGFEICCQTHVRYGELFAIGAADDYAATVHWQSVGVDASGWREGKPGRQHPSKILLYNDAS